MIGVVLGYTLTLLALTLMAGSRGHSVWFQTVAQTDFFAPPHPAVAAAAAMQAAPPQGFVPPPMTSTPVNYAPVGAPPMQSQSGPQYPLQTSAAPGWTAQSETPAPYQVPQSPYPQV